MSHLFQSGLVRLSSGAISNFKIECDALTGDDWLTISRLIASAVGGFGSVEGVPSGGSYLASLLSRICTKGPHLVVDDVLTTGNSISRLMKPDDIGFVVFARGRLPPRVQALFTMHECFQPHSAVMAESAPGGPGQSPPRSQASAAPGTGVGEAS